MCPTWDRLITDTGVSRLVRTASAKVSFCVTANGLQPTEDEGEENPEILWNLVMELTSPQGASCVIGPSAMAKIAGRLQMFLTL